MRWGYRDWNVPLSVDVSCFEELKAICSSAYTTQSERVTLDDSEWYADFLVAWISESMQTDGLVLRRIKRVAGNKPVSNAELGRTKSMFSMSPANSLK